MVEQYKTQEKEHNWEQRKEQVKQIVTWNKNFNVSSFHLSISKVNSQIFS